MNLHYIVNEYAGKDLGEGPWTKREDAKAFLDAEVGEPHFYRIVSVELPAKYEKSLRFVTELARDHSDAIWQPEWLALKTRAAMILCH